MLSKFKFVLVIALVFYGYSQSSINANHRLINVSEIDLTSLSEILLNEVLKVGDKDPDIINSILSKFKDKQQEILKGLIILKAAKQNKANLVQYLLDIGTPIDVQYAQHYLPKIGSEDGILHIAARLGHIDVANVAINYPQRRAEKIRSIIQFPLDLTKLIVDYEEIPDFINLINFVEYGNSYTHNIPYTAFDIALQNRKYNVAQALLKARVSLTPLMVCEVAKKDFDPVTLKIILEKNVHNFILRDQDNVKTPLIVAFAFSTDNIEIIKRLIDLGADVNAQQIVTSIEENKRKIYKKDSALIAAVRNRNHSLIKLLIENKADPNVIREGFDYSSKIIKTPLSLALIFCDLESIKLLLSMSTIDVNLAFTYHCLYFTPLQFINRYYNDETFKNTTEITPEMRNQVIELLTKAGAK